MKYLEWFKNLKKQYQIGVIILGIIIIMYFAGLF